MTNIVIYARFSSHAQNEQSIEGQLKACREYAKQNEYTIIHEYIDRAISGTSDKRPEFQRMIEESAKRRFEYVLVYQLDRFARNRYDSAINKSRLKKNGVRVISARENISDDASGILIEGVLESMAEYYSAELSQKITRGMEINASKCLYTGGRVALGYYIDENKRFQIDQDTSPIVKMIFEMYAKGLTMTEIIRYLNSIELKTSINNEYNKNSLRKILTNKRFTGVYIYKDIEIKGGIPQIITDELFNEVQIKMEKNQKAPARSKAKVDYLLTTKLFCGLCEGAMIGVSGTSKNGKPHYYYSCNASRKKQCAKKNIRKDWLEDLVIKETKKLLTDKKIDKISKEIVAFSENERNTPVIQHLQKSLKENEKATENLIKALEQGQAVDIITERIDKRKAEHIELEKQLAKESFLYPALTIPQVKFFMERFKNGNINDLKYRKSMVDTFIRRINLYEDKMTILYNAQDSQSTLPLGDLCSPNTTMVEIRGLEPLASALRTQRSTS